MFRKSKRRFALFRVAGIALVALQVAPDMLAQVFVDDSGVMRWLNTGEEVSLFGVNYGVPFAHGYRALGYLGVDRKKAIDADVSHFARLGLDAFRVHVWDRQITDRDGKLIENDHLDLLDYLIARLSERGIKTILTPIAWWGAGYPEPDPETSGISDFYSKGEMTTDPIARRAQVRYVKEFVTHVNPYTGMSYGEDPNIIAIELFNEPSHPGGPRETTRFINELAGALRSVGTEKPVFYNISQGYSDEHGLAVCAADIDGVSVQWYPTGLVRNGAVGGNMLPNVDSYPLPFANFADCRDKARMVYEFDAADVAGSYMYPAMARSFRASGFQWATQFAYDPLGFAFANTDYQTHFLNLVFTPGKAISFMIAGEAFRRIPRGASYGTYPETATFDGFRVSYEEDVSELVADTVYYYSSSTKAVPPSRESLRHVAGVGSSPVVSYGGRGAYFLDRIANGVWRLQVFPDAVEVVDPYTRPSLRREAVRVYHREHQMEVALPDLGSTFVVRPRNAGNTYQPVVKDGSFTIIPGIYALFRDGAQSEPSPAEFFAPPSSTGPTVVMHEPPGEVAANEPLRLNVEVASSSAPDSVLLFVSRVGGGLGRTSPIHMTSVDGYTHQAVVPSERVRPGLLTYRVAVFESGQSRTFPGPELGHPYQWDFSGRETWEVYVADRDAPLVLFDARRDRGDLLFPAFWNYVRYRTDFVAGTGPGRLGLRVVVESFEPEPHHFAIRSTLTRARRYRLNHLPAAGVLRIRARTTERQADTLEVALVTSDGLAWGTTISLSDKWVEYAVPIAELVRTDLLLLPRPYPHFLPYRFRSRARSEAADLSALDGVQFSIGGERIEPRHRDESRGFEIESVTLSRR